MTAAPVTFPGWMPPAWREAFDPSLLGYWPPAPDPTLPWYWSAGLVARKLFYMGAIRNQLRRGTDRARAVLSLAGVTLVPMRGWKRYTTPCPACGRLATVLMAPRAGDAPFCLACRPKRLEPVVTLLAALNAEARLAPLPPSRPLLEQTVRALTTALRRPRSATLLSHTPTLLSVSPADALPKRLPVFCPRCPGSPVLGWQRTRSGHPSRRNLSLTRAARSLHPVAWCGGHFGGHMSGWTGEVDNDRRRAPTGAGEEGALPGEAA